MSSPASSPSRSRYSTLTLFFLSLAAGLSVASAFLLVQRWLRPTEPSSGIGTGYSEAIGSGNPNTLDSEGFSAAARTEAFEKLRLETERLALDLDAHFDQEVLPLYDEAERYAWHQLGLRENLRSNPGSGSAPRLAEHEHGK